MRVRSDDGADFEVVQKGDKLVLVREVNGREQIVAVYGPNGREVVTALGESPEWEKGPANWGQWVASLKTRVKVDLPPQARPPWA